MVDRFSMGWAGERHKGVRVGTLWTTKAEPDGDVSFSPYFDELDDVAKIDILEDVIGLLECECDEMKKFFPEEARELLGWRKISDATRNR